MILSLMITYNKIRNIYFCDENNSPRQKITIRPVFMCSPLNFCKFMLSSNLVNKKCDNNPSGLRKSTYS